MSISGIGTAGYPISGYQTRRTERNTAGQRAAQQAQTAGVTSAKQNFTLHWFQSDEGDTPIGASAVGDAGGSSVTVYKPKNFDPENPVYKVKIWDAEGNVTERMVNISKVDPKNCDAIDMFAYSSHLADSGECPDAQRAFMGASSYHNAESGTNLFRKENWLDIVKEMMQMQYDAGNLTGYLDYKKFWDYLN